MPFNYLEIFGTRCGGQKRTVRRRWALLAKFSVEAQTTPSRFKGWRGGDGDGDGVGVGNGGGSCRSATKEDETDRETRYGAVRVEV